jgi:hypothetical protein
LSLEVSFGIHAKEDEKEYGETPEGRASVGEEG